MTVRTMIMYWQRWRASLSWDSVCLSCSCWGTLHVSRLEYWFPVLFSARQCQWLNQQTDRLTETHRDIGSCLPLLSDRFITNNDTSNVSLIYS